MTMNSTDYLLTVPNICVHSVTSFFIFSLSIFTKMNKISLHNAQCSDGYKGVKVTTSVTKEMFDKASCTFCKKDTPFQRKPGKISNMTQKNSRPKCTKWNFVQYFSIFSFRIENNTSLSRNFYSSFLGKVFFIIVIHLLFLHSSGSAATFGRNSAQFGISSLEPSLPGDTINKNGGLLKMILRLQPNPKRITRSTTKCRPALQQLSELVNHAYLLAKAGSEKIHTKRHANHPPARRSTELLYQRTHEELKKVRCDTNRRGKLFGIYTDNLHASLSSMSNLLRQEMNDLNQHYTSWSRSSCDDSVRYSGDSLRRRVINQLFEMQVHLQYACDNKV